MQNEVRKFYLNGQNSLSTKIELLVKQEKAKPKQNVPILKLVSRKRKDSLHASNCSTTIFITNRPFTHGPMLDLRASISSKVLANKVQTAYPLPWTVIVIPDENGCVCLHDELFGKTRLGVLAFRLRAWEASIWRRASLQLHFIQAHCSWERSLDAESAVEVEAAVVGSFGASIPASSATKALLSSTVSSSILGDTLHEFYKGRFFKSLLRSFRRTWGKLFWNDD